MAFVVFSINLDNTDHQL